MVCPICGYKEVYTINSGIDYIIMECKRCGVKYLVNNDYETTFLDFDKGKLHKYILDLFEKIKNEGEKNYLKGCYVAYVDALYNNKKKVREWGLTRLMDLIKKLQSL